MRPGRPPLHGDPRVVRDTRLLVVAGFFMSTAQSLSSVAMPVALLRSGAGAHGVGTVLAAMSAVAMVETVLVGAYADRGHLRLFLVVFPLASAIGAVPFLGHVGWLVLGAGAVVGGFGGGSGANSGGTGPYQPAEYGWIARYYPAGKRNRLVSSFSARGVAGVILASAIALAARPLAIDAGFGASQADQARFLMLLVALLALVPAMLGGLVGEPPRIAPVAAAGPARSRRARLAGLLWPAKSRGLLLKLSITNALNGLAIGTYGAFLTTWLVLRFHASPSRLGLVNLVISATAVFGDLACPVIARHLGLVRSVLFTRSAQSLLIIPIALSPTLAVAQVLLVLRQLAQRLNQPLRSSYVLARADPDEKARMAALSTVAAQGTQAASSQVAGALISRVGFTGPFIGAGLFQFASGLLFYRFFARQPPPEEAPEQPPEREPVAAGRPPARVVTGADELALEVE